MRPGNFSPAHLRAHIAPVAAVFSCQSPSLLPHSSGRNILSLSHPSLTAGYWRSSHAHDTALLSPSSRFRRALVLAPSSSPDDSRTPCWCTQSQRAPRPIVWVIVSRFQSSVRVVRIGTTWALGISWSSVIPLSCNISVFVWDSDSFITTPHTPSYTYASQIIQTTHTHT